MNFLDLLIVIPLIWFGYKGFRNGFVMEAVSILALIAGIYIAVRFSAWVGQQLGIKGEYAATISFIVTFAAVLLITYLLGKFIDGLVKKLVGLSEPVGRYDLRPVQDRLGRRASDFYLEPD